MKRSHLGRALIVTTLLTLALPGSIGATHAQPEDFYPGYGGYGPRMMGPGMMGPGMMGPRMMGPGMWGYGPGMWGYGPYYGLDLSSEQRTKIAAIQNEFARKHWELMYRMHEAGWRMRDVYRDGKLDEQAARKAFAAMSEVRNQMFEAWLEAQKRMDAALTAEQREKLRSLGTR